MSTRDVYPLNINLSCVVFSSVSSFKKTAPLLTTLGATGISGYRTWKERQSSGEGKNSYPLESDSRVSSSWLYPLKSCHLRLVSHPRVVNNTHPKGLLTGINPLLCGTLLACAWLIKYAEYILAPAIVVYNNNKSHGLHTVSSLCARSHGITWFPLFHSSQHWTRECTWAPWGSAPISARRRCFPPAASHPSGLIIWGCPWSVRRSFLTNPPLQVLVYHFLL